MHPLAFLYTSINSASKEASTGTLADSFTELSNLRPVETLFC